jgi:regulator of nucleoside diphosphate kinase
MNDNIILRKEDYELLMSYLKGQFGKKLFDRENAEAMQLELQKAKLVSKEEFPEDAIGLYSIVRIKDNARKKEMELELVTPDKADISKNKVSVLAPIGVALIGFRQGEQVQWKMPSGERSFTILDVKNNLL